MGVIARPARRFTCQRASPRRTMTEPRPYLGDEQRQSAAQRLGCDRTVPSLPRAEHDFNLCTGLTASVRAAVCQVLTASAGRYPRSTESWFAHSSRFARTLLGAHAAALSQGARLTRSASEFRVWKASPVWP